MEQIIAALSARLHLPETVVRAGVGILLNFIRKEAAGSQFEKFIALIPGAGAVAAQSPAISSGGSGSGDLLGGLLEKAGGLFGGNLGAATEAVGALHEAGVPMDKAAPLAGGFFEHVEQMIGPAEVGKLLQQVPALKALLSHA